MNKIILIFIALVLSFQINAQLTAPNYGWPLRTDQANNTNHRATITGTPGEHRPPYIGGSATIFGTVITGERYHQGVDMVKSTGAVQGDEIYSIEPTGSIIDMEGQGGNRRLRVANFIYWHVNESQNIFDGDPIAENSQIGTINSGNLPPHLHFQPAPNIIAGENNLLSYKLPGYQDNNGPTFGQPETANSVIEFYPQGHHKTMGGTQAQVQASRLTTQIFFSNVNHTLLYGKIDMVVGVLDRWVSYTGGSLGTGHLGANKADYNILDINNNSITGGFIGNVDFSTLPAYPSAEHVFGYFATSARPRYVITNHPRITPYDRYWNTKLRQGVPENWNVNDITQNARYNQESVMSDGKYTIRFRIGDIDSDGENTLTEDKVAIIDNFKPYIEKVQVRQDNNSGTLVYNGQWDWNGTALTLNQNTTGSIGSANGVYIKVFTSEPMQNVSLSIASPLNYFLNNTTPIANSNNQEWEFIIPATAAYGVHTLNFNGVDYANNQIEQNPSNIPIRQNATTWAPTPQPGIDTHHQFEIDDPTIDIGPISLTLPASSGIFSTNELVFVRIKNFGGNTIDFNNTPVIVNVDITGPINTLIPTFQLNGTLLAGGVQDFLISSNVNLSLPGVYNFNITTFNSTDNVPSNDEINVTVTSQQAPNVSTNFYANTTNLVVGGNTSFFDQTTGGPTSWQWSFSGGTPSSSTNQNPQNIVYNTPGIYDVTLTSGNSYNNDVETKTGYIYVSNSQTNLIDIDCSVSNSLPNNGTSILHYGQVNFAQAGTPPYTYRFIFGDGKPDYVVSNIYNLFQQVNHTYTNGGNYTYTLIVTDFNNNQATCSENISVFGGVLNADFTMNGSSANQINILTGQSVTFADATTGGSQPYSRWVWDYDPEMSSNIFPQTWNNQLFEIINTPPGNPPSSVTYNSPGTYKVRLDVSDQNWYNGVKEKTVFVSNTLPPPTSTLSIDAIYLLNPPCFDGGDIHVGASISGGVPFPNNPPDPPSLLFDIYPHSHFPHNDSRLVIPLGTTFPHTVTIHIRVTEYILNGTTYNHVDGYDTVTFYDGRISVDAGDDLTLCTGTNFVLGSSPTASGGTPPYIYNWSELTTNNVSDLSNLNVANPIVTANGGSYTYGVTVSDDYGCVSATDQVVVTTQDLVANAGPTKNICIGSTNQTIGLPPVGGLPPYSYSWSPAMDLSCTNCESPTVSPSLPGLITYVVNVIDATGCTSNAQVFVNRDIANPIASITPPNPACEDVPISLTGSGSNATGPFTYLWSNGSTSPSITITPSSTAPITLTVTDQNTGCFDIESIPVSPKYDLVSTGTAHIAVCAGIPFTIGNSVNLLGGTPPYSYLWSETCGLSGWIQNPTARYPTVAPLETVHYKLEVTDVLGCSYTQGPFHERYFVYSDIPHTDFTIDGGACENVTCIDNLTNNKFTGVGSCINSLGFQDITQYSWSFGNGSLPSTFSDIGPIYNLWNPANPQPSPDPPCINYNSTGIRTISLTATNVCGSNTMQKTINITSPISGAGTQLFCGTYNSNFNNLVNPLRGFVLLSGDVNCLTLIENNAVFEVLAVENINIKPGFKAEKGSNFGARLDPFQCYNVTSPRMMISPEENDFSVFSISSENYEILIQPNPTNSKIDLYLPDENSAYITIINAIGDVVYTNAMVHRQINIDLSSFPKGIYIIKTLSGTNIAYKKVIKN